MVDMINPINDDLIGPYLALLGIDTEYPVQYIACNHRNLQGQATLGYIVTGELQINASFLNGPFATSEDRIIAAGYRDLSLSDAMTETLGLSREYVCGEKQDTYDTNYNNPHEQAIVEQIKVLDDLLLAVRGNPFKHNGERKTLAEQNIVEPPEKRRKKAVRVAK